MSSHNRQLGQYGEQLAADFLIKRNYRIIDKNFQTRYGEIDLIASQGDEILFVEVKTRTNSNFGYPELAVNQVKLDHLTKTALFYLDLHKIKACWNMAIISIEIDKTAKTAKIKKFIIE